MIATILCPVDFTPVSEQELQLAARLAQCFDAELIIQHNLAKGAGLGVSWMHEKENHDSEEAGEAQARERLSKILNALDAGVRAKARAVITWGALDHCVQSLAEQAAADLIVIGTHGRGGTDHASETERLITRAPCPVLTTHDDAPADWLPDFAAGAAREPIHTLVPVDFSAHSAAALRYALELSETLPLEVTALYVVEPKGQGREWAQEELNKALPARHRGSVKLEVKQGAKVDEILLEESLLEAHLAIMGAHAKGIVKRLLTRGASTAREMLHRSRCPVWFVPKA